MPIVKSEKRVPRKCSQLGTDESLAMTRTFPLRVRPQGVAMSVALALLVVHALWQQGGFVLFIAAALLALVLDSQLHGACVVDGETLRVHTHRFRPDRVVALREVTAVEAWRGCAVVHRRVGRPLVLCVRDVVGFCAWIDQCRQTTPHEDEDE